MSASSFSTHVMRYCVDYEQSPCLQNGRCRGHRLPRPPAPDYAQAAPFAKPRRQAKPLTLGDRYARYEAQNRVTGSHRHLTARQQRQARRMFERARMRGEAA